MSRKILAGNWKMNTLPDEGKALCKAILNYERENNFDLHILIFPPATHLAILQELLMESHRISMGAQNAHSEEKGAFTGEISVPMIKALGAEYLLVGHSERRNLFKEEGSFLLKKINKALDHKLKVVFCFGEPLEIRQAETYKSYIKNQLEEVLFKLSIDQVQNIILAYEPVWAIGTGKNARPEQAQEVHAFVRNLLEDKFGKNTAESTSILYGGSCKPANAEGIFAQKDVDGGLIGGASLKADDFTKLYEQLKASGE